MSGYATSLKPSDSVTFVDHPVSPGWSLIILATVRYVPY